MFIIENFGRGGGGGGAHHHPGSSRVLVAVQLSHMTLVPASIEHARVVCLDRSLDIGLAVHNNIACNQPKQHYQCRQNNVDNNNKKNGSIMQ